MEEFQMANISKRGKSYRIRVSCGFNGDGNRIFKTMSWTPPEGMTEKQIEKELQIRGTGGKRHYP